MAGKIFISYRRSDSDAVAHRMFDWLVEQFGPDVVFIDIDRIPAGADWRSDIAVQVRAASVVLVVIAETWLEALHARADNPKDVLRLEIETALAEGKSIIPVLIERTDMPDYGQLPVWAARLPDFNAARVSKTADFKPHMERLGTRLAEGFGFKRLIGAGVSTPPRPATAYLVVPSTYRGPAMPPPKQGETWESIELPKDVRNFWSSGREYFGAAWLKPERDACRLALFNRARLGFFDFRTSEFNVYRPFGFWPIRNLDVTIEKLVPHGDEVIFACREGLFKGGKYSAGAIANAANQLGICDASEQSISLENTKGWWAHFASYYSEQEGHLSFCDIYKGNGKLARVSASLGRSSIDGEGMLAWSPTGDYAITAGDRMFRSFMACRTIDDLQVIEVLTDRVGAFSLPSPCNHMYCRPIWHSAMDVFALATYRLITAGRVSDWHIAIYDAAKRTLLHSFSVDEPRQLNVIAWNATGRFLATGGDGRCVFVHDLLTGQAQKLYGHSGSITRLAFSPDGQRLLSSGDRQCIIWNPETGDRAASWEGSVNDRIREAPWSPDASMVATDDLQVRRLVV